MRSALLSPGPPYPHIGVDIVDLGRIARARGNGLDRYICSAPELAELTADNDDGGGGENGALRRLAATWAVKEAAIKAAGGRPGDFSWTAIRVINTRFPASQLDWLAGSALHDAVDTPPHGRCRYHWPQSAAGANPYGVAAWCAADGFVTAITINAPNEPTGPNDHCADGWTSR